MSVPKSDEYRHNNPNRAFVDSDYTRGGRRRVADREELYGLVVKADQLKQDVTIVRIMSDDENDGDRTEVLLVDDTNIGNATGWELYSTGGAAPGGPSVGYSDYSFTLETDGPQSLQLPADATDLDGVPSWYQADTGQTAPLANYDFTNGNLVILAGSDVRAGDKIFGRYTRGSSSTGGSLPLSENFGFDATEDGAQSFAMPVGTQGIDYPVQVQQPNIDGTGSTRTILPQHCRLSNGFLLIDAAATIKKGYFIAGRRFYGASGGTVPTRDPNDVPESVCAAVRAVGHTWSYGDLIDYGTPDQQAAALDGVQKGDYFDDYEEGSTADNYRYTYCKQSSRQLGWTRINKLI